MNWWSGSVKSVSYTHLLGAVADGAAPEDGLIALLHIGHGGDIHHELVHADPAQHRAGEMCIRDRLMTTT